VFPLARKTDVVEFGQPGRRRRVSARAENGRGRVRATWTTAPCFRWRGKRTWSNPGRLDDGAALLVVNGGRRFGRSDDSRRRFW